MLTEKKIRRLIRGELLNLISQYDSRALNEAEDAKPADPSAEEGTGSASLADIKVKLKELVTDPGSGGLESQEYAIFLEVLDEILKLAEQNQLKTKKDAIMKALGRFSKAT